MDESVVLDLSELADRYLLADLQQHCLWFIESSICDDNAVSILQWVESKLHVNDSYSHLYSVVWQYLECRYVFIKRDHANSVRALEHMHYWMYETFEHKNKSSMDVINTTVK
jgi:hypothetical protein